MLKRAAAIKANNRLSLADAWIAASAELSGGILIHKDPEFESLGLAQEALPMAQPSTTQRIGIAAGEFDVPEDMCEGFVARVSS